MHNSLLTALLLLEAASPTFGRPSLFGTSLGGGRDTDCVEPPPPLRGYRGGHRGVAAGPPKTPPAHLKYIGMDGQGLEGSEDDPPELRDWTNLVPPPPLASLRPLHLHPQT